MKRFAPLSSRGTPRDLGHQRTSRSLGVPRDDNRSAARTWRRYVRHLVTIVFHLCVGSTAFAQGYPPDQAAQHMTVPAGFRVDLVAAEPIVRQPVCTEFDDRGRLWVVQYLQYPNPAGLKRVKVDR